MKYIILLWLILSLFILPSWSQEMQKLSPKEIEQIKNEIIKGAVKHSQDLVNLDYKAVMKFYANVEDFALFGDGEYWGDYITIDQIWKSFTSWVKKIMKWDFKNHHVYVFSNKAASYLAEYDNERVDGSGDTTKVTGSFAFGLQKFNGQWKAVTVNVTHNYKPGYGFERHDKIWWRKYSPDGRKNN
jgi:hypothetical protein